MSYLRSRSKYQALYLKTAGRKRVTAGKYINKRAYLPSQIYISFAKTRLKREIVAILLLADGLA